MPIDFGCLNKNDGPHVVAVVDTAISIERLCALVRKGVSVLEIRGDLFGCAADTVIEYVQRLRGRVDCGLIATVRADAVSPQTRLHMLDSLIPFVDAIDMDISAPDRDDIRAMAKGKTVIISMHDFEKTPACTTLRTFATRASEAGADIVKIATMANTRSDVSRLLTCIDTISCDYSVAAMAMGCHGTLSRMVSAVFGSVFTYCFAGEKEAAPGQLSAETLLSHLGLYYPDFTRTRKEHSDV